jgi:hypothetical protein
MKARFWRTALNVIFLSIPLFSSGGQVTYSTVNIPYPLESLDHSPRAEALGSAFTAVEGDSACLFYNPAGLAGIQTGQISIVHQDWLAGLSQENLTGALSLGKGNALALGLNYLNFGALQGYSDSGFSTSTYQPFRGTLALGWGSYLFPSLAVGLSARGLDQSLSAGVDDKATAWGAGFLWKALPRLNLGAFYTFLYTHSDADLGQLKCGASYLLPILDASPLMLSADLSLPPEGVYQVKCGAEQSFFSVLTVRLGSQWDLRDNQIDGLRGLTAGLGLKWEDLDFDASFAPDGTLGSSQMLGLTYRFPEEKPNPPAAVSPTTAPLNFVPPLKITPADKVVNVEVHFTKNEPPAAAISPEIQRELDRLGRQVQDNPKDAKAWIQLGTLYWQTQQPEYTIQCFEEALQLQPDNTALKSWLGQYQKLHPSASTAGE